jgi:adenylylsulfate kinase
VVLRSGAMSWAIWITGLPGSGKSTIARAASTALAEAARPVTVLELDAMRRIVTPTPSYSEAERDLVYRALVWVAAMCVDAGVPVLVDATAHRREWRDLARTVIPAFAEVQLTCGLEACRTRSATRVGGHASQDVYARAGTPGARVPGVDVEYEPASAPELTIDTETTPVPEAAARLRQLAHRLPAPPSHAVRNGWTIWVTGLPGSGKTTIVSGVAEALVGHGMAVCALELGDLLFFIAGGGVTPLAEQIAHRALVYAAKLLSDAGLAVLVDATAPARAWRELARELIPRFAEVQLVCPAEICATRERAVRWRLMGCAHTWPRRRTAAPDIALAYEPSLCPELTIHTDVEDPWSATAMVVRLARRLHLTPTQTSWTRATAG